MKKNIRKAIEILNNQNLKRTDFVQLMEGLKNPYLVLVFCILSLRTKDETTYGAAFTTIIGKIAVANITALNINDILLLKIFINISLAIT